jgi:hypothetical protein
MPKMKNFPQIFAEFTQIFAEKIINYQLSIVNCHAGAFVLTPCHSPIWRGE